MKLLIKEKKNVECVDKIIVRNNVKPEWICIRERVRERERERGRERERERER